MKLSYIGPWDWLSMFWNVIAYVWGRRFIRFGETTMPQGFSDQFIELPDQGVRKYFFSVGQTGASADTANLATVLRTEGGIVIVCDSTAPACKVEWLQLG